MIASKNFFLLMIFIPMFNVLFSQTMLPYQNKNLPLEQRIEDLLKRMTLKEKIRQMDMYRGEDLAPGKTFNRQLMKKIVGREGIGAIHDLYPENPELVNQIQKYALEQTRLGIPVLFIEEALHGYLGKGSTTFPAPIGLASSWNRSLLNAVGKVIAGEARAHGIHFVLAPVLGLAREPRWGRVEETYGEDPYLSAELGLQIVKGMQGDTLASDHSVVAEPKHFGAHSQPEAGSNTSPVFVGEREMRSSFLAVFEKVIKKGHVLGVMAAYHELDGIPCVANDWLLKRILRKEWGFKGFVLSDMNAIGLQVTAHHTARNADEALVAAIKGGTDMQFYDFDHRSFQEILLSAVEQGLLDEREIDRAVRGILYVKFVLGLFENPYVDPALVRKRLHTKAHQQLALQAGREAIVLLKNEENLLPLPHHLKKILVVGPMANAQALGGYSPHGVTNITLLKALRHRFSDRMKIDFEPGVLPLTGLQTIKAKYLTPAQGSGHGLWTEFFAQPEPQGKPVCARVTTNLAPYWGRQAPCKGMPADSFSVRWSGFLQVPISGLYEIGIITDDRGRLFLNDKLFVDNWQAFKVNVLLTEEIYLKRGQKYPLKMEFGELTDYAGIRLKWRLIRADEQEVNKLLAGLKQKAEQAEVVLAVLGENESEVGEGRDKANLNLSSQQVKLVDLLCKVNKNLVAVLINGRPLTINTLNKNVPAILESWFAGEAAGQAICDVLFGDYNPSGKLPITFPKSVGQVPFYYNHKPSSRHSYVDMDGKPLFPFGHGLSYTQFTYSDLKIEPAQITPDGQVKVQLKVTNSGQWPGSEVVQLYLNDVISSVTTPLKTLQGFEKVFLKPGESKVVQFKLNKENLGLWNRSMRFVVEPGRFNVMLGSSSEDIRLQGHFEVVR